jgi:diguanylate cyclase (GGDEF)-like protein
MPEDRADQSWSTSQLIEFLAVLSGQFDKAAATRSAVERVLESLDAEIGILLGVDQVSRVVVGLPVDDPRVTEIVAAAVDELSQSRLDQLGECRIASVALAVGADSERMLVVRLGSEDFLPTDLLLLRGMAWVLDLTHRQLGMLAELNERQRVLEHVARVQRDIAARVPLPEVFDAVTESALSLIGSEFAVLHLFDREAPSAVSICAASKESQPTPWLLRLSTSVAEEVSRRDSLVHSAELEPAPRPFVGCAASSLAGDHGLDKQQLGGIRVGMGAPVRENGTVVGGLVVISSPSGQPFADPQEQALATFANQVSVALSDVRTQLTAQHATRDAVTGLPNRILFLDQLDGALATRARVDVLFLDLDRFKRVNDTLGHAVGDELLRRVGHRLRGALRAGDLLARFGGDEFAILLENATDDEVRSRAERLLAAVGRPYQIGVEEVAIGCSIGVATAAGGASAPELLRNADTAMYRAKHSGGGHLVAFEELRQTRTTRRGVESDLRHAMGTDALRVVFQPIVSLRDGALHAVESLARWDHPDRGLIAPADFIPVAEETGLIVPLGRHVLGTACAHAAAWSEVAENGLGPSVTVNISARQLFDPGFLSDLRDVLADSRLEPDRLILEITEGTLISDPDRAREVMRRLREVGVRLALDDFGTGSSTVPYLRTFPVEFLKIDKSFVESVAAPWQGRGIVAAIVRLGHSLSMTTVAEGVETDEQATALLEVGCEIGQGFLLARPMSSAEIVTYAGAHATVRAGVAFEPEA